MLTRTKSQAPVVEHIHDEKRIAISNYFGAATQLRDGGPQAYLAQIDSGDSIGSHFHPVDQFQVFYGGEGCYFARESIGPLYLHYADAYTPYGPFGAGPGGMQLMTLRPRSTDKHFSMPASRAHMLRRGGRLRHCNIDLDLVHEAGCKTLFVPEPDGLAAYLVSLDPGTIVEAPTTVEGHGQYLVVVKGQVLHSGLDFPFQSVFYLPQNERPLALTAHSEEQTQVLVLQFPSERNEPARS